MTTSSTDLSKIFFLRLFTNNFFFLSVTAAYYLFSPLSYKKKKKKPHNSPQDKTHLYKKDNTVQIIIDKVVAISVHTRS